MKIIPILLIGLCVGQSFVFAGPGDSASFADLDQKITLLQSKIERLAASQERIIHKNNEISKELDSLRIWIRRNRS